MSGPSGFSGYSKSANGGEVPLGRRRFVLPLTISPRRFALESVRDAASLARDSLGSSYRTHNRQQGLPANRRQHASRHRAYAIPQIEPREQTASRPDNDAGFRLPARSNIYFEETFEVERVPIISGAGGGLFFFWQLGVLKYLQTHFDLSRVHFRGASAGGLIATLACCGVDLDLAVEEAYNLSLQNCLFERPLGLIGIWGDLIRYWLHILLPSDAHKMCSGRLKLVVTDVLGCATTYADQFDTRDDLIDACMASAHVPFVLDWKPFAFYRGRPYLDGSLMDFITWSNSEQLTMGGAVVLDYTQDDMLTFERFDFLKLRDIDEVKELINQGYTYGQRVVAQGNLFEALESVRHGLLRTPDIGLAP